MVGKADETNANKTAQNRDNPPNWNAMSQTTIDPAIYRLHEGDTGSADVQIALLSARINDLTEHLAVHQKDFSSRRGLLRLVSQRRRLLDFLAEREPERYQKMVKGLGLRR